MNTIKLRNQHKQSNQPERYSHYNKTTPNRRGTTTDSKHAVNTNTAQHILQNKIKHWSYGNNTSTLTNQQGTATTEITCNTRGTNSNTKQAANTSKALTLQNTITQWSYGKLQPNQQTIEWQPLTTTTNNTWVTNTNSKHAANFNNTQ